MSFGSTPRASSGPPASPKQLSYLLDLVRKAGFEGFNDARRSLGLTQKQSKGRFTGKEASALIDALISAEGMDRTGELPEGTDVGDVVRATTRVRREEAAEAKRIEMQAAIVRGVAADLLADERRRRGWSVEDPAS